MSRSPRIIITSSTDPHSYTSNNVQHFPDLKTTPITNKNKNKNSLRARTNEICKKNCPRSLPLEAPWRGLPIRLPTPMMIKKLLCVRVKI